MTPAPLRPNLFHRAPVDLAAMARRVIARERGDEPGRHYPDILDVDRQACAITQKRVAGILSDRATHHAVQAALGAGNGSTEALAEALDTLAFTVANSPETAPWIIKLTETEMAVGKLEATPAVRIESLHWRFDPDRWLVEYEVALSSPALPGSEVAITFEHGDRTLPALRIGAVGREVIGSISLLGSREIMDPNATLWSPLRPNLIGATVTLTAPGAPDDTVESYLGLRSIETTPRGVKINGALTYLRFVLHQAYWPESQLVAPSPEALETEADLILKLGFNGARIHQKVEDPRFLFHADRKGILLWGEMANAFTYSDRGIGRLEREWRDVVLRDRNHPSIIAWVPYNESWGVNELSRSRNQQHAVAAAYHQTHQLDGTRPVVGNDGWEQVEADIFTIHDYNWDADLLKRRYADDDGLELAIETHFPANRPLVTPEFDLAGKPVIVTEYGGVSFAPEQGKTWYGYGTVRNEAEFIERYRELTGALTSSELLAGFCYTQLTDTLQEPNGLLTENREPKAPFDVLKKITQG